MNADASARPPADGLVRRRAGATQFAFAFCEVLRQLVDDLGLALGREPQATEPCPDLRPPISHARAP